MLPGLTRDMPGEVLAMGRLTGQTRVLWGGLGWLLG
jgi:hypothetical protein